MSLIKIARNYQVTIPARLRQNLNLKEGDYLEVSVKNGSFVFSPVRAVKVNNPAKKFSNKK